MLSAFANATIVRPDAKLVLAGKGVLQDQLHNQAHEAGIADRVHFAGYLNGPALTGFYRCCDVLVVPSLYEPFGIVALEGLINRTPVIASDAGGLAEIIEHERNGLQFPAGEVQVLTQRLVRMLEEQDTAQALAQQGYEDARQRFHWDGIASRTVEAYQLPQHIATAMSGE